MSNVRFGLVVDSDNGAHVRFRLFAATGGQHLGGCGQLVMTPTEFTAFHLLLEPKLDHRPASGWTYDPANPQDCSHRDDQSHDHDQCIEQMGAQCPHCTSPYRDRRFVMPTGDGTAACDNQWHDQAAEAVA